MFLPVPRVRGTWVALVLVALTPLSAIAVSPVKKFPKSCVWRVINAEAPFYLVGSIHALDKNDYPLPSPYEVALRNSTRFVFEFDPNRAPEFERKFEAAAKYPPGQDIRSKIDPALLRWLRQNIFTLKTDPREGKRPRAGGLDSELCRRASFFRTAERHCAVATTRLPNRAIAVAGVANPVIRRVLSLRVAVQRNCS